MNYQFYYLYDRCISRLQCCDVLSNSTTPLKELLQNLQLIIRFFIGGYLCFRTKFSLISNAIDILLEKKKVTWALIQRRMGPLIHKITSMKFVDPSMGSVFSLFSLFFFSINFAFYWFR